MNVNWRIYLHNIIGIRRSICQHGINSIGWCKQNLEGRILQYPTYQSLVARNKENKVNRTACHVYRIIKSPSLVKGGTGRDGEEALFMYARVQIGGFGREQYEPLENLVDGVVSGSTYIMNISAIPENTYSRFVKEAKEHLAFMSKYEDLANIGYRSYHLIIYTNNPHSSKDIFMIGRNVKEAISGAFDLMIGSLSKGVRYVQVTGQNAPAEAGKIRVNVVAKMMGTNRQGVHYITDLTPAQVNAMRENKKDLTYGNITIE